MTKFLSESGLTRLVALIKQALGGKQPSKFIITATQQGASTNFDKTYAEILAAYNTGADIELHEAYSNDIYKFVSYNGDDEVIIFECVVEMTTLCRWSVDSSDTWDYEDIEYQRKLVNQVTIKSVNYTSLVGSGNVEVQPTLVSGTNIKTVNNNSLLGSGNVNLNDAAISYDGNAANVLEDATNVQEALDLLDGAVSDKQDALVSGTNIKTINNTSLLGSGNISIEPNEIASITTSESSASGGNNTVTITETNGISHTFNVKNGVDGQNGVSLGQVAIADNQTTDDATQVLSARQGKLLGDDVSRLKDYEFGVKTYDEDDLFKNKSYTNNTTSAGERMTVLANYGCIKIPVTKGDKLTIATSGASGARAYSLCDEDLVIYLVASSNKDTTSNPDTISVTKDGYCHINCKSAAYSNFGVTHYYSLERQMLADNTRSLTQGEMNGTSDWIRDKLETLSWEFNQYVKNNGTTAGQNNYCASPFIPVSGIKGHNITFCYMFDAWSTGNVAFYNSSEAFMSAYYNCNANNVRTVDIGTGSSWDNAAYLRMTCNPNKLSECYIYDNTDEVYIWKGDEYLGTIYENNLVNYKTFRDVLVSQESGESEMLAMSQKAITEYGRKVVDEDFAKGRGEIFCKVLQARGWLLDKILGDNNAVSNGSGYCVTPYFECDDLEGHILAFQHMGTGATTRNTVFCDSSLVKKANVRHSTTNIDTATISVSGISCFRMTLNMNDILHTSLYDNTAKQFLFKGDEYIYSILNEYNMSYGYLGDKDALNRTFDKPNYIQGMLGGYYLSEFPKLNPVTCDGISLLIDGNMTASSSRTCYLELFNKGTYNVTTGTYFAIAEDYGLIRVGLMSNYYMTVSNGTSYTRPNPQNVYAHMVITFNFKNGNLRIYNNGVEIADVTPASYSETTLREYLSGCTYMRLGHGSPKHTGMAVFPYVLEESDVKSLYDIGAQSTKGELIPQIWQANLLHPQVYTGENIGIYLRNTNITRANDGDAAVLTSVSTFAQFGFTGINGTINNHIYEWDMEVVSGTWTQDSRGMIYNNNYYKVVNIYDSNGNDVSYNDLTIGNYHVVCKPNNILARNINAAQSQLNYMFTTTAGAVMNVTNLKVVEKGAALVCDINNFKGEYFQQVNGDKIHKEVIVSYGLTACTPYYDTYKADMIAYSSSTKPQYTGQMAIDTTNNKVYVGYLTGAGTGTWKQINNS